MNPFGGSRQSASDATGASGGLDDGSGFLHPESSLVSSRDMGTSEWLKERSSQQLELEDVHSDDRSGCCRRLFECTIKALHVLDVCLGMAMIVYGSLLLTQFAEPARAAADFCLVFGTIHFIPSTLGIVSYFLGGCRRFGLIVSAYTGAYFASIYLITAIVLGMDEEGFLAYLDDNKEVMYLGPNVTDKFRKLMPLFYTILAVLAFLEASRWCVVIKIHERLRRRDKADPFAPTHHSDNNTAAARGGGSSVVSGKSGTLTEALLDDVVDASVGTGGGTVGMESTGTPNWWDNK
mmetsp:Transcript_3795/g.9700  ORF Transcript_3795/g.9700 Transcript_3795/m.9700 type:complete len:293 (+) Transcript_3795:71-949(+)